jgi:hypothetical protein
MPGTLEPRRRDHLPGMEQKFVGYLLAPESLAVNRDLMLVFPLYNVEH